MHAMCDGGEGQGGLSLSEMVSGSPVAGTASLQGSRLE